MAAYNNMNKNEENASGGGSSYGWQQPTTLPVVQPMPAIPYVGPAIPYVGPKPAGLSGSSGTTPIMDPENLHAKNFAFNEDSIRKGFIRKVYLILMGQLLFTFGIVAVFLFHEPTQLFTQQHPEVLLVSVILAFGVVISMACCETTRRTFPTNFICLGIFTICESIMLGAVSSTYKSEEVFMAIGITAFLCLTLTIFAMQTKYDFTACGGILLLSLVALILFGFVAMFWRDHVVQMIYASVGALLACIFLIYDTQMMMGGTHKYSISPEEYIFAALNLYMDVVRIFLYVLRLIGSRK